MSTGRIAFDPALPFKTTAAFACGERSFAPDEPFPWKDLGVSELELHALWRAAMVTCVAEPNAEPVVNEATVQFPGVTSQEVADRLEQRERKQRRR